VVLAPLDYDELERWTRVGFERGNGSATWGAMTLLPMPLELALEAEQLIEDRGQSLL